MFITALVTFLSGAIYEAGCVAWVHFSERAKPLHCAIMSMLVATATVFGIGESIQDMRMAPFFIIGYGVGSYFAVRFKSYFNTK